MTTNKPVSNTSSTITLGSSTSSGTITGRTAGTTSTTIGDLTFDTSTGDAKYFVANGTGGGTWADITVAGAPTSASLSVGGWDVTFSEKGDLVVSKQQKDGNDKKLFIEGNKLFDLLEKMAYAVIE